MEECVRKGSGKSLYVSGMPGTGKTASVHHAVRRLIESREALGLPEFEFVELNALRLAEPAQVYVRLYQALSRGERLSPSAALAALDAHFGDARATRKRPFLVVLVDEIDLLVTRNQTVLYNLFEWPHRKAGRVAIVAVANTMDLPERTRWGAFVVIAY